MKQARRCSRERRPKRTKSGERAPKNTCRGLLPLARLKRYRYFTVAENGDCVSSDSRGSFCRSLRVFGKPFRSRSSSRNGETWHGTHVCNATTNGKENISFFYFNKRRFIRKRLHT